MNRIEKKDIVETAIALIRERGFLNVTVNDICDACGITKPTFYKYVGSKEELILNLYDHTIGNLTSDSYQFIEAETSYEQLVIIFAALIRDTMEFGSDLFSQMLISNLSENHHSFDMRDHLTQMCYLIVRKAQKNGEIRNTSAPEVLYQAAAHLFTGYETVWCISGGETDFAEEFFTSLNALLDVREDLREIYKKRLQ